MNRRELEAMTKEELVDIAVEHTKIINELRGYDSGLKRMHFEIFSKEELVDGALERIKRFGL